MFDIGWQELFIIAVLAIIIVGPKDLPGALRTVTKWLRKARSVAREFQSGIDDMVRESDLDDVKKQLEGAADYDIAKELENTIDPTGAITADIEEMESELSQEPLLESETADADDTAGDEADDAAPEPAAESSEPAAEPVAEKPQASGGQGT
jgi:sec-independent protein translocase protein TatB